MPKRTLLGLVLFALAASACRAPSEQTSPPGRAALAYLRHLSAGEFALARRYVDPQDRQLYDVATLGGRESHVRMDRTTVLRTDLDGSTASVVWGGRICATDGDHRCIENHRAGTGDVRFRLDLVRNGPYWLVRLRPPGAGPSSTLGASR